MDANRKIIAAVDLSGVSRAVVAAAERMALRFSCGVRVVHTVEPMAEEEDAGFLLPMLRRLSDEAQSSIERDFNKFVEALPPPPPGVTRECVLGRGKAYAEIIRHVRLSEAPLLVIGAPHPSSLTATTLGRVLRRSPVPVLVMRRPTPDGYRKVLVGVDFSPCSEGALSTAALLAEKDAVIEVMNLIPKISSDRLFESVADTVAQSREELSGLMKKVMPDRASNLLVEMGNARSDLVEHAKREGTDLIAVGVSATSAIADIFLGSVADAVARNAPCDSLIFSARRAEPTRP